MGKISVIKHGDMVFIEEELMTLPDFPPTYRVIPVMSKKIFRECFKEWICEMKDEEDL